MNNEEIVRQKLSEAIESIKVCLPLLEKMDGKIPSDILNKLDVINGYSVLY